MLVEFKMRMTTMTTRRMMTMLTAAGMTLRLAECVSFVGGFRKWRDLPSADRTPLCCVALIAVQCKQRRSNAHSLQISELLVYLSVAELLF